MGYLLFARLLVIIRQLKALHWPLHDLIDSPY